MNQPPLNPDAVSSIADVILRHCGGYVDTTRADAERAAKAVLRSLAVAQPVVTTLEELDALPVGSVVRGGEDDLIGEKIRFSPYLPHWCTTGEEVEADKRDLLPARVLHRPEVES